MNKSQLSALRLPAIVVAGVVLAVILTVALSAQQQTPFQLTQRYAAPKVPATQTVYRLVPLFRTADDVHQRALQLGLSAATVGKLQPRGATYRTADAKWTYIMDTKRQFETLFDTPTLKGAGGRSFLVPPDNKCRELALEYLGTHNIAQGTDDEKLVYERTNELVSSFHAVADGNKPSPPPIVTMREVVFAKTINGVPTTGQGTHVSVYVGDKGKIIGHVSNWMPALPTPERVEVAPGGEGFGLLRDRLVERDRLAPTAQRRVSAVTVEASRYALVISADQQGQLLAVPGYQFRGQVTDRSRRTGSFTESVAAPRSAAVRARLTPLEEVAPEPKPQLRGAIRVPRILPLPR